MVVDGTDLVDEQIGIPGQLFSGFDPYAEWFCIVDEICGNADDDCRGMARIPKGPILGNENGSDFSRPAGQTHDSSTGFTLRINRAR